MPFGSSRVEPCAGETEEAMRKERERQRRFMMDFLFRLSCEAWIHLPLDSKEICFLQISPPTPLFKLVERICSLHKSALFSS